MTLTSRLAARGLSADYKPIRGAEAFMAGELDDAHLLAEHRAACERIKELEREVYRLQAWIIDAVGWDAEELSCEWMCPVVCAGPCEGVRHG